MSKCLGTTSKGYGCANQAQPGRTVCASHDQRRHCGEQTKTGEPCKRLRVDGHDTCSKHW